MKDDRPRCALSRLRSVSSAGSITPDGGKSKTLGDARLQIIGRQFNFVRTLEQAHNDQSTKYRDLNTRMTLLVVLLNAFAAFIANIPLEWAFPINKEASTQCEREIEEFEREKHMGQARAIISTIISVATVVLTGFASTLGYDAQSKLHTATSKQLGNLVRRFEHIAQCASVESFVKLADVLESNTHRSPTTPASVDQYIRPYPQRGKSDRLDSYTDWFQDFQRVMDTAPILNSRVYNNAKQKARSGEAHNVMVNRLCELQSPMREISDDGGDGSGGSSNRGGDDKSRATVALPPPVATAQLERQLNPHVRLPGWGPSVALQPPPYPQIPAAAEVHRPAPSLQPMAVPARPQLHVPLYR